MFTLISCFITLFFLLWYALILFNSRATTMWRVIVSVYPQDWTTCIVYALSETL